MSLDKFKEGRTWRKYKLSDERGIGLISELLVYCVQRCRCPNCKQHFIEEKIVEMMEHWPGTKLNDKDRAYLYRMIGHLMGSPMTQIMLCTVPPFDIAMGADYCINKLIEKYDTLMARAEKESSQCNPDLN